MLFQIFHNTQLNPQISLGKVLKYTNIKQCCKVSTSSLNLALSNQVAAFPQKPFLDHLVLLFSARKTLGVLQSLPAGVIHVILGQKGKDPPT